MDLERRPSGAAFHGAVIANPQPGLPLLHTFQIGAINQTFTILDEEISDSVATDGKSNPALHYRLTEAPVITAGGLGGGLGGGGGFSGGGSP